MSKSKRERFTLAQEAYFSGTATLEDIQVLNELSKKHKALDEELSSNLHLEANLHYLHFNQKPLEIWRRTKEQDQAHVKTPAKTKQKGPKRKPINEHRTKKTSPWVYAIAIAALILLAWGLPKLMFNTTEKLPNTEQSVAQSLQPGEIIKGDDKLINLPDGSVLKLKGKVKVPTDPEQPWSLLGNSELLCEITKKEQEEAAFKVETSRGLVTVMGTKFTLSSNEDLHWVELMSGSIQIDDAKGKAVLTPGDSAVLSQEPWELYLLHGGTSFKPLRKISNNSTIDVNLFKSKNGLNIRIEAPEEVRYIKSKLVRDGVEVDVTKDGEVFKYNSLENYRPFHLFGEKDEVIHGAIPPEGELVLEVEAHMDNGDVQMMNWTLNFQH